MLKDFDRGFKIIVTGSTGVGKSSLLLRYVDDIWTESTLSTIGVDLKFKAITVKDKKVKIQIWDTAGSETFRSIVSAYYRGADAVVLVYDVSNRNSLLELQNFWIEEIRMYKQPNCQLILLANKCDIEVEEPFTQEVRQFVEKENFLLHKHTSAKTGEGIAQAFQELVEYLVKSRPQPKKQVVNKPENMSVYLDSQQQEPAKKRCCK